MVNFGVLDEYAGIFYGQDKKNTTELERRTAISLRDKWILKRFLDGYLNRIDILDSNTLTLIPTSGDIERLTIDTCVEGIKEYFLEPTGLEFDVIIEERYSSQFESLSDTRVKTEAGIELHYIHDYSAAYLRNTGKLPWTYMGIIDSSDFFQDRNRELTGLSNMEYGVMTLLQRAIRKGRFKDGHYMQMNEREKIEYMKLVSAHEAYHIIGLLSDLDPESHSSRGFTDRGDCLGYSDFQIPADVCDGCKDGIIALWYGVQLRTGKSYIHQ